MIKSIFVFALCTLFSLVSLAQENKTKERKLNTNEETQKEKAQFYYNQKNYRLAMPIFETLLEKHPNENSIKYFTALCYAIRPDKHPLMLQYLTDIYNVNKKADKIEYELARAYFFNYKLDEASNFLNQYIAKTKKPNAEQKKEIDQLSDYIKNAKNLMSNPINVKIENLGNVINTTASECSPYVTMNDTLLIYTYRGEKSTGGLQNAFNEPDKNGLYYEDVFISTKVNDVWAAPQSLQVVNSNNNDEALSISYDGTKIFTSRDSPDDDGDIYMSTLVNNEWTTAVKLMGDVNTPAWEDNACLSPDGKTLFFSSSRPGGYGGKDIYKSILQPDGTFGIAQNLGDKINTLEDEDDPFFHLDGKLFIFSSKGHNSMGGYDIFKTYFNPLDSSWSVPENIGYPINTTDDDIHYSITPGGDKGYYGISKADGLGDNDLYSVEPGIIGTMPAMVVVKGIVMQDSKPMQVDIEVSVNNTVFKNYKSNAASGFYQIVLPLGKDYKLTWKLNDSTKTQVVEAANAKEYILKINDVNFKTIKDSTVAVGIATGNEVVDGLVYKIQVSAHSLNKNIDKKKLKAYGKIEKIMVDNEARFVLKTEYKTLNQVNEVLAKIRAALVPDAFIVCIYKEKRYYLYELQKQGIIPPDANK